MDNTENKALQLIPKEVEGMELVLNDGQYHIKDSDDIKSMLEGVITSLDAYTFDEDDFKKVKTARADVNRVIREFKADIKERRESLFEPVTEQFDTISELLKQIVAKLNDNIERENARFLDERMEDLEQRFRDTIVPMPNVDNDLFTLRDIMSSDWTLRSISDKRINEGIQSRTDAVVMIYNSDLNPIKEIPVIIEKLREADWDSLKTVELLKQEQTERDEAEEQRRLIAEARENRRREQEKRLEQERLEEENKTQYLVTVDNKKVSLLEAFLTEHGISYEVQ